MRKKWLKTGQILKEKPACASDDLKLKYMFILRQDSNTKNTVTVHFWMIFFKIVFMYWNGQVKVQSQAKLKICLFSVFNWAVWLNWSKFAKMNQQKCNSINAPFPKGLLLWLQGICNQRQQGFHNEDRRVPLLVKYLEDHASFPSPDTY